MKQNIIPIERIEQAILSGVLRSPQTIEVSAGLPLLPMHSIFGVPQACLSFSLGRHDAPKPEQVRAIQSGHRLPARPLAGPTLQRASLGCDATAKMNGLAEETEND